MPTPIHITPNKRQLMKQMVRVWISLKSAVTRVGGDSLYCSGVTRGRCVTARFQGKSRQMSKGFEKSNSAGRPCVCSFERCRPQKCPPKQDMMVVCRYNFGFMWKRKMKSCLLQRTASGPVDRIKGNIFGSLSRVCCTRKQTGVSCNHSCAFAVQAGIGRDAVGKLLNIIQEV